MTIEKNNSVISTASTVQPVPVVIDYNLSQITPYLFVTAENTARQFPTIFANGIACVINLAHELPQIVFPSQSGIESLKFPIRDNPQFPAAHYFDVVADRIAANVAANRRTLLYCHQGRSRSVTFILAYLIKHHRLPLPTAFTLVREKRQLAAPNVGFWSQLQSYEADQQKKYLEENHSTMLRTLQNSLMHGQQFLHKVSGGFERMIYQIPVINTFANAWHQPPHETSSSQQYRQRQRHSLRRIPSIHSNSSHVRLTPSVYHRHLF